MNQFVIAIAAGAAAGILDCIPMLIKKLDPLFILSAFCMWLVSGILVYKAVIFPIPWLNGICLAVMILLPLSFLIFRLDKRALPQIIVTTIILGGLLGMIEGLLIG